MFKTSAEYQSLIERLAPAVRYESGAEEDEISKKLKELNSLYAAVADLGDELKVIHGIGDDRRNYYDATPNEKKAAGSDRVFL